MELSPKTIKIEDVKSLFNKRERDCNKGNFGYVGVMGGCPSYSGAVKLANMAQAALRSGCGVSRLIVPKSISNTVSPYLVESTLFEMPCDEQGYMFLPENINEEVSSNPFTKLKSLSIGMGWGSSDNYKKILEYVLKTLNLNLIIDADGLNTLSRGNVDLLLNTKCHVVLTPHIMEFSRLSGYSIDAINADKIRICKEFANKYHVVLLLKGADTIITDGENMLICNMGCPGMATAGSGDVLSGVLTGLLGYMPVSVRTVAAGAYINGLSGCLAAEEFTEISMTAGDTVNMIPKAIKKILFCELNS